MIIIITIIIIIIIIILSKFFLEISGENWKSKIFF